MWFWEKHSDTLSIVALVAAIVGLIWVLVNVAQQNRALYRCEGTCGTGEYVDSSLVDDACQCRVLGPWTWADEWERPEVPFQHPTKKE